MSNIEKVWGRVSNIEKQIWASVRMCEKQWVPPWASSHSDQVWTAVHPGGEQPAASPADQVHDQPDQHWQGWLLLLLLLLLLMLLLLITSLISTGKVGHHPLFSSQVSVASCSPGEVVLVLWSEEHTNYQVFLNSLVVSIMISLLLRSITIVNCSLHE